MTDKLKPCPFCKSEVQLFIGVVAGLAMIVCPKCKATVSFGGAEKAQKAVERWNRRAKDESTV